MLTRKPGRRESASGLELLECLSVAAGSVSRIALGKVAARQSLAFFRGPTRTSGRHRRARAHQAGEQPQRERAHEHPPARRRNNPGAHLPERDIRQLATATQAPTRWSHEVSRAHSLTDTGTQDA